MAHRSSPIRGLRDRSETALGCYSLRIKKGLRGLLEVVDEDRFFNHSFVLVFPSLLDGGTADEAPNTEGVRPIFAGSIFTPDLADRRVSYLGPGLPSRYYSPYAFSGPASDVPDVRDFSGDITRMLRDDERRLCRELNSLSIAIFVEASEIANGLSRARPWRSLLDAGAGDLNEYFPPEAIESKIAELDLISQGLFDAESPAGG